MLGCDAHGSSWRSARSRGRVAQAFMAEPEITEDALLGGRLRIRQPKRGYRVNVDTLC